MEGNGEDEKEDEFQIGLPTDVKHVAHIGSDEPGANAPSWISEYKTTNDKPPSGLINDTAPQGEGEGENSKGHSKHRHGAPKSRPHSIDSESNNDPKQKPSRRHHRSSDPGTESSIHDSSNGGSRHRRQRRGDSNHGSESHSQEMPPAGAKPHRRRSKNSEDGSVRKPSSSRRSSRGDSLSDISVSDFGSIDGPESSQGTR
ncbi:hypothetical protein RJT34_24303 [Clitoria ternatea]|uniref:CRIB domain-containing protein n=1 Tax=Clitoria ternatea TaxID=43366 RepID=A0AAN9FQJ0_CLITE